MHACTYTKNAKYVHTYIYVLIFPLLEFSEAVNVKKKLGYMKRMSLVVLYVELCLFCNEDASGESRTEEVLNH